jgi:hypothetical protein
MSYNRINNIVNPNIDMVQLSIFDSLLESC